MTRLTVYALAALIGSFLIPASAHAGCGCTKPAPVLAQVRPHATYAGTDVHVFHPSIQVGGSYTVRFVSGTTSNTADVAATGVSRRDLADGQVKPQVVVSLPQTPLGPTEIQLIAAGAGSPLLSIDDAQFTVVPTPVAVPETPGFVHIPDLQGAVTRSGVVYLSLDLSAVRNPRLFDAQFQGFPLRFDELDVVFYNNQGFLMQLLGQGMPGLSALENSSSSTDSDMLTYSRHEFTTFFLQHDETQAHAVDPTDANWHLDGTPHIDHDFMIVAIMGTLPDGSTPVPGATPVFDFALDVVTYFDHAIYAADDVDLEDDTVTDSYNSAGLQTPGQADLGSADDMTIEDSAILHGNASATDDVNVWNNGWVDGQITENAAARELLPILIPSGLTDLGDISITSGTMTLSAGSYRASKLYINGNGKLVADTLNGPVTLYVTGQVYVKGNGVELTDPAPEKFALYITDSSQTVYIKGSAEFTGVIYAPDAAVEVNDDAVFFGSIVAHEIDVEDDAIFLYDTALRGQGLQ